jgi:hypothetical protein
MAKKAIGYKDDDGNYGFRFTEDGRIFLGNTSDDIISVTGTLDVNGNLNVYNDVVVRNTTYGYESSVTHFQENFEGLSDGSTSDPSTSGTWTNGLGSKDGSSIDNAYGWIAEDTDANSSNTGPDNAHSGSIYVFTEASSRLNKYYALERIFTSGQSKLISKLSLYYHMYGANMGALSVYASGSYANSGGWIQLNIARDADGTPATASTISGQQHTAEDEAYKRAESDLDAYSGTDFSLRIIGLTGGDYPSDLAIDAIEFIPKRVTLNVSPTNISASVPFSGSTFSANSFHGSFYGSGTGLTSIPAGSLASDCVETAKILDSNVTTAKIADDAVTAAKIDSTASPTVAGLTLTGDLNVDSGTLFVDVSDADVRIGTTSAVSNERLQVRNTSSGYGTGIMITKGSSSGSEYLSFDIAGTDHACITAGAVSSGNCDLSFRTSDSSETERMRIKDDGKVGIGTDDPKNNFHVQKNAVTNADHDTQYNVATFEGDEARVQILAQDGGSNAATLALTNAPGSGANKHWMIAHRGPSASNKFEIGYLTNSDGDLDFSDSTTALSIDTSSNVTVTGDLFVNDYARIDALRVGTTSTDPGDGNLYIEGDITLAGGDIKDSGGHNRISFGNSSDMILKDYSGNTEVTIGTSTVTLQGSLQVNTDATVSGDLAVNGNITRCDDLTVTEDLAVTGETILSKRLYIDRSDTGHPIGIKANSSNGYGWYLKEDDSGDYWSCRYNTSNNRLEFVWKDDAGSDNADGSGGYIMPITFENLPVLMWTNELSFTGQHRCVPANESTTTQEFVQHVGKIVFATGDYKNFQTDEHREKPNINQCLPTIEITTMRNQKSVFGVVSNVEDPNEQRTHYAGNFVSMMGNIAEGDDRVYINSLGEGGIWITNISGNIENGDYITTCEIPGYGMKQDDDLLHNYTVAKITQDCLFDLNSTTYECEEIQHDNTTYRAAFVGCTYHCG